MGVPHIGEPGCSGQRLEPKRPWKESQNKSAGPCFAGASGCENRELPLKTYHLSLHPSVLLVLAVADLLISDQQLQTADLLSVISHRGSVVRGLGPPNRLNHLPLSRGSGFWACLRDPLKNHGNLTSVPRPSDPPKADQKVPKWIPNVTKHPSKINL